MENEIKATSYRVSDTTKARFKEIMAELDATQQDTMEALIAAYDLQNNISTITDSKKQDLISNFRYHTSQMNQDFIAMIHWLQDADERAESKVSALLMSKDAVIEELQDKLKSAKLGLESANQQKADALNKMKVVNHENLNLSDLNYQLKKQMHEAENSHKEIVKDKNELISALNEANIGFKSKIEEVNESNNKLLNKIEQTESIIKERDQLISENADLQSSIQSLNLKVSQSEENEKNSFMKAKEHEDNIIDTLKKQAKFDLDQALLIAKEQSQEQIQTIREEAQKKIDEYQLKYFNLLEQLKKN